MPSDRSGQPKRILVIQTAFLGDVILATAVVEQLHIHFPEAAIDFLLRKGNEALLKSHPFLNEVLVWDKKKGKLANLFRIIKNIRAKNYDVLVNLHRFTSSGIVTILSKSKWTIGFDKNPLSFLFNKVVKWSLRSRTTEKDLIPNTFART